jgi:hypothetical protein
VSKKIDVFNMIVCFILAVNFLLWFARMYPLQNAQAPEDSGNPFWRCKLQESHHSADGIKC